MINFIKHQFNHPDGSDAETANHTIDIYVDGQSTQIVLPIHSTPEEVSLLLLAASQELI